jgi:hypothetical protein
LELAGTVAGRFRDACLSPPVNRSDQRRTAMTVLPFPNSIVAKESYGCCPDGDVRAGWELTAIAERLKPGASPISLESSAAFDAARRPFHPGLAEARSATSLAHFLRARKQREWLRFR